MAKHPVPKKKMSQSRSAMRYASFKRKKQNKIIDFVQVINCPACGNPMLNQKACSSCGAYRGRNINDALKPAVKVTKVKA